MKHLIINVLLLSSFLLSMNCHAVDWAALNNAFQSMNQQRQPIQQNNTNDVYTVRDGNILRYYTANGILIGWAEYTQDFIYEYSANGVLLKTIRVR